ncbi:unnamed protein product [Paramecium primaurelia]|uniref:Uncharacterized protein n=1 Tax=Paramecium primaurelia TaxID=5886 RepID=A0A8S1Q2P9_PARPR|nr:unnamed protein product [Paramecium primaurelia]
MLHSFWIKLKKENMEDSLQQINGNKYVQMKRKLGQVQLLPNCSYITDVSTDFKRMNLTSEFKIINRQCSYLHQQND